MKTAKKHRKQALPDSFRPLLWSYVFEDVDPEVHKNAIVLAALNYGTLAQWRWIVSHYGLSDIRNLLTEVPVSELRPGVKKLVSLLLGIDPKDFNHASRGSH